MQCVARKVSLTLVSDRPDHASLFYDVFRQAKVSMELQRMIPGEKTLAIIRQSASSHSSAAPDAVFFDFTDPHEEGCAMLQKIAFGKNKAKSPVILMTSPESLLLLESGDIDGGGAIMFSPTGFVSFARKMRNNNRAQFFKALRTLYQFGPILVRAPRAMLQKDYLGSIASA
jgi:hypothetical protein